MRVFLLVLLLSVFSLSVASAQTRAEPASLEDGVSLSDTAPQTPVYRLGTGDQVRVIVFGENDLSGEFFVDGAGYVSVPLIGEVQASGKTLVEFRAELESLLADGYLIDPRVSAEVLNYRPFYILGEVENSGEYPYTDGLTVVNAVARAGGFTYRANERRVMIQRAGTTEEVQMELTPTLQVLPGDTIRVLERFF